MCYHIYLKNDLGREDERRKREVVLPFEPHSIVFDEVKYSVDMPQVACFKYETSKTLKIIYK